ncbi:hypothetical protein EOL96_07495 [Candidatus Saccharibacteria bacterium]|nr:hypothetical protein [Candidatus Saccharibacteria bacterium]
MIQINLIPDVKREYLHAKRMRDVAISLSTFISIVAAGAVGLMLLFLSTQAARELLADRTIEAEYDKLSNVENLSDMVTIQNQLSLISVQHADKSMNSRLFKVIEAINPIAPNDVRFTSIALNPEDSTLTLEGQADAGYIAVETLVKTVQNTSIDYTDGSENAKIQSAEFASDVTVSETSYGIAADNKRVLRFKMTITHVEGLFDNTKQDVEIVAPEKRVDVTDSKLRVPDSLFAVPAADEEEGEEE